MPPQLPRQHIADWLIFISIVVVACWMFVVAVNASPTATYSNLSSTLDHEFILSSGAGDGSNSLIFIVPPKTTLTVPIQPPPDPGGYNAIQVFSREKVTGDGVCSIQYAPGGYSVMMAGGDPYYLYGTTYRTYYTQ